MGTLPQAQMRNTSSQGVFGHPYILDNSPKLQLVVVLGFPPFIPRVTIGSYRPKQEHNKTKFQVGNTMSWKMNKKEEDKKNAPCRVIKALNYNVKLTASPGAKKAQGILGYLWAQ